MGGYFLWFSRADWVGGNFCVYIVLCLCVQLLVCALCT